MQWYRCISEGRVQHVYYRKFVSQAMMRAGFNGYVRNLDDGRVETVVFIADEQSELPQVHQILQKGSPMSSVTKIVCAPIETIDIQTDGFEIRH